VEPLVFPDDFFRSTANTVRLQRYGSRLSTWITRHDLPGRIRLYNLALYRRRELCQAVERELMNAFGADRYSTNEFTATVLIHYNSAQLSAHQLIEMLESVLPKANDFAVSPVDLDLPICTASVAFAVTSEFFLPVLAPLSAAVFLYSVIPSFKNAYNVVFKEKRLGVDVLDALVVATCLLTNRVAIGGSSVAARAARTCDDARHRTDACPGGHSIWRRSIGHGKN
jgi:hypothetical protein